MPFEKIKGVWASGLSMSALMGLRDANEASFTQVLDHLETMVDSICIPILVDGDTGYGNFNNARRFVHKLEHRNVAGVCFEDKLFPKANSLLPDEVKQPLASIDEFCKKIDACKVGSVVYSRVKKYWRGRIFSESFTTVLPSRPELRRRCESGG